MRKLRRFISRAADVVCVVLLAACLFLHVYSYFHITIFGVITDWTSCYLLCAPYVIYVGVTHDPSIIAATESGWQTFERGGYVSQWWFSYDDSWGGVTIGIPLWSIAVLTSIKPTWSFVAWRRRRGRLRAKGIICMNCGYDLRGNPGAAACPECGCEIED